MKISIFFFIFLFVVLTSSFIQAQPPFEQSSVVTTEGIFINNPPTLDFIERGQDYEFITHISNQSNGFVLNSIEYSCDLHIFNSVGEHIVELPLIRVPPFDYERSIDGGNFTQSGDYSYFVNCNDSRIGGFTSNAFQVNSTGLEPQLFPYQFVIILLGFLFIVAGLVKERLRLFKYVGSFIFMVMGVITLYPGYSFIDWNTLIGQTLGLSLIGCGFYFLIEDSFSRGKQQEYYDQEQEDKE